MRRIILLIVLLSFTLATSGIALAQQITLPHTGGNQDDSFGEAVAVQADTILVGAPYIDDAGNQAGAVYVYNFDGVNWTNNQILIPVDIDELDFFGASVAIDGNYAVAGAYGTDSSSDFRSGSVYIYRFDGVTWHKDIRLSDSTSSSYDDYGSAVSVSGEYVFVGVPGDDDNGTNSGSVFVYHSDAGSWSFHQKLMSGSDNDNFGKSISVDGAWAAIGAFKDSTYHNESGAVYMYHFDGVNWTETQKIKAGDPNATDWFGLAVALDGQQLLIGAPYDNDNGPESGSIYIFSYDNGTWTQQEKISASDGSANQLFGAALDISRKYAVVGASNDSDHGIRSGATYLLHYDGRTWVELLKFSANDAADYHKFGFSVALSDEFAVIGAPRDKDMLNEEGIVYVFDNIALYRPIPATSKFGILLAIALISFLMFRRFSN
ncbi:FG-GAP repeat protein [bacterium]|nr:FG-GAP repeat protein [bacterium]